MSYQFHSLASLLSPSAINTHRDNGHLTAIDNVRLYQPRGYINLLGEAISTAGMFGGIRQCSARVHVVERAVGARTRVWLVLLHVGAQELQLAGVHACKTHTRTCVMNGIFCVKFVISPLLHIEMNTENLIIASLLMHG